ncbi:Na+/H+ antiporter NhaC family protein [Virgibacillus sp. 179-BFC.A HS]|uniref:Na+/H+ antiporter NhaC family protein n=1 Tax=Tigheibacillus jepli TaxID=3035914 RepID=A0ABU5CFY4_9BACI|nr:Na+/H+ antiporter NhaC family protein [Virgibacillus sp. 179-BFC.A HS]MDY0405227.1 Na+/H+ antiporter NhaC family protein [Virgibacillus sp. 179-BFC.A HS]
MIGTFYSIIPALIMLLLVVLTRKVLLSLGAGIIIGALFIHNFHIGGSIQEIWQVFAEIFYQDGAWNTGNLLLLLFLLLLGTMTALLQATGGSRAFGEWASKRIKTRAGAQLMTVILGIVIFIDDYFNALAVGQIARPLTDKHRISRAKLAYFIDSTSAPVTVLAPISSWGAYIIGILGGLFAVNNITDMKPLTAFIEMIPYNFYAIGALVLIFVVALAQFDIGPMYKHEVKAWNEGELVSKDNKKIPGDLTEVFKPHEKGKVYHLFIPIAVLVAVTVICMFITGLQAREDDSSFLEIFANTNVNVSLAIGGITAVVVAFIFYATLSRPKASAAKIIWEGIKTMLPAIYILLLAWMIGSIIGTLKTGEYLADIVTQSNISPALLPFIFFLIAGIMSLATGTSWGTFGIMLPIAVQICAVTDMTLLIPTLSAVLAGSVFGDHCTPISDTTILSSTGAGAHHIDHVMTQLPYAFIAAFASAIGYLVVGLTGSLFLSFGSAMVVIAVIVLLQKFIHKTTVPKNA